MAGFYYGAHKAAQVTYDNHVLLPAIKIEEHCVGFRNDASE